MTCFQLSHLRGRALDLSYDRLASAGARNMALQLAHLAELDRQGYYLDAGCKSMFRYCVDRKGLSEDVAVQWIRVARVAREHPQAFESIADGRLTVSAVHLLARHVTRENGAEVLAAAEGRSNKQVFRLVAERFGRRSRMEAPPVGTAVLVSARPAPDLASANSPVSIRVTGEAPLGLTAPDPASAPSTANVSGPVSAVEPGAGEPEPLRARLTPIGPGRYELVAIIGQQTFEQLEASRELLAHAVPSGALIEVLERAIAAQHEHLRRRRCAATESPRTSVGSVSRAHESDGAGVRRNPRRIPAAVRRAVWNRDGDRCAFVSADGYRCHERSALELDHVVPIALGGRSTIENLRLLCRAHNQHAAERTLGREHVTAKREAERRRRAAERFHKDTERRRTEQRRVEIEKQREELGEAFRQLGYRGRDLEIALAYCASRAEAPLEERLKYALGCMAPQARREGPAPDAAA